MKKYCYTFHQFFNYCEMTKQLTEYCNFTSLNPKKNWSGGGGEGEWRGRGGDYPIMLANVVVQNVA